MYSYLPNVNLSDSPISRQFKLKGVSTFHEACDFIWRLPYGRTNHQDLIAVLSERKGTCSSKHRLLKALVDELDIEGVELKIGIYLMHESNTPGVGSVMNLSEFDSIPEAHCYLHYDNRRIDLTRSDVVASESISNFLVEVTVEAETLPEFKEPFHYQYIVDKYGDERAKAVWACREQCIAALGT
ncbi:hypothetical protein L1D44_18900 [Shewanella sp. Isolate13]|uniref:hypothetical protein n=1 Tax=Shewanella sp. Isolate13 TaxID=2908531 RepID=UPI001EFD0EDE|nr:hypothetical protein [Shewanella sp. Isolate13]MCG9731861.1 hypothetical protein [Shewanella sp. Isolate13]